MEAGWSPRPEDNIRKGYEKELWELQQIVAKDLQLNIISADIARAEMKEVAEVVRVEIAKIEKQDTDRQANAQRYRAEQTELSDIVKNLA